MPDLSVIASRLPGFAPLVGVATRWRWWLCLAGALEAALMTAPQTYDMAAFAAAGGQIVGGRPGEVYATSFMQGGPLELLASWALFPFAHQHEADYQVSATGDWLGLRVLGGALLTAGMMLLVRHLRRVHDLPAAPGAELAAGVALLVLALPNRFWSGGHLAEFGVPLFWVLAASLAVRGHTGRAAVLLGLSAAWETWGLLAAGLLLIDRNPRRLLPACLVLAVAGVGPYLPFVVTGQFAMFELHWPVVRDTFYGQVFPDSAQVGWAPRLAQGLATGLAGCAAALALGRRRDLVWLGPLTVVVVRLLLDPLNMEYYWQPVLVLVTVGIGLLHGSCSAQRLVLLLGLAGAAVAQLHREYPWPNTGYLLVVSLLLTVLAIRRARREESVVDPHQIVTDDLETGHHGDDLALGGEHLGHRGIPGQLGQGGPGRRHQPHP